MQTRFLHSAIFIALTSLAVAGCTSDDDPTGSEGNPAEGDSNGDSGNGGDNGDGDNGSDGDTDGGGHGGAIDDGDGAQLPIVFVHGYVGSAQQYQSQAMRFVANGYPMERIVAYEHNGGPVDEDFVPGLDQLIDETLEKFDEEKVYLVGHSRGTFVSGQYLSDPARLAKVAKYISLDGQPCPSDLAIPCTAPNQGNLPGQKHVEVATSKESFVMQYKFLFDKEPEVVDIVKQEEGDVVINGRVVNFPENTGREGVTLEIWEVDPETGMRAAEEPLATFEIGAGGDWGPVTVDPEAHYEHVLTAPDSDIVQHFYAQPYLRSTNFARLLSGPPDSASRVNTNVGEGHSALTLLRMREWLASDIIEIGVNSDAGDVEKQNVVTEDNISNEGGNALVSGAIGLYIHDDKDTPGESSLSKLPYFSEQPFQAGIDVYMPAADPPNGTISVTNMPRGDTDKPQTINVPNWPSSDHTVMVMFADFPHE